MTEGHRGTDIAIIGIGAVMPGARTTRDYWLNIINKAEVLSEISRQRWDWRLYYDQVSKRSL